MSVAAETSKTVLEVYQPLIVGLGAVVLGFLANGFLEWWRVRRDEEKQCNKLRKAILIDLRKFEGSLQSACESLAECKDKKECVLPIFLPMFFQSINHMELGGLELHEIDRIAVVRKGVDTLITGAKMRDDRDLFAETFMMSVGEKSYEQAQGLMLVARDNVRTCIKTLRSYAR